MSFWKMKVTRLYGVVRWLAERFASSGLTPFGIMSIICLSICRREPVMLHLPYSRTFRLMALSLLQVRRIWFPWLSVKQWKWLLLWTFRFLVSWKIWAMCSALTAVRKFMYLVRATSVKLLKSTMYRYSPRCQSTRHLLLPATTAR